LRASERQAESILAREQWTGRQRIQHPDQACIVKWGWSLIEGGSRRCFTRRQKLEGACDIAPKAIEKGEIITA
jgi:hypothetical protein